MAQLGPGRTITRTEARSVVGSEAAANMFLAKAVRDGLLVPTAWNRYRVPPESVLQVLGRVPNPMHRRLVSWCYVLPGEAQRTVCFAGPRLWRDTDLSVDRLIPVLPLRSAERRVPGLPPQWDAFYQDLLDLPERWRLVAGKETLAEFHVPSASDTALLLAASLDPRWRGAALQMPGVSAPVLAARASRLARTQEAPRGARAGPLDAGPPHRIRLLAPTWYVDKILEAARDSVHLQPGLAVTA